MGYTILASAKFLNPMHKKNSYRFTDCWKHSEVKAKVKVEVFATIQ